MNRSYILVSKKLLKRAKLNKAQNTCQNMPNHKSHSISAKRLLWIWIAKPLILLGIFYLAMYFVAGIIISNLV